MTKPRVPVSETISLVYQTRSDGRWHGKVTVARKPNGDAIRRHVSGKTRNDVKRKVREVERQRDAALLPVTGRDMTLGAWLERWLERVVYVSLEPKTYASYSSAMRRHVIPELGTVRLRDVSKEMAEDLYALLASRGLSRYTVHSVHRTLRSAMSDAVAREYLPMNPVMKAAVASRRRSRSTRWRSPRSRG